MYERPPLVVRVGLLDGWAKVSCESDVVDVVELLARHLTVTVEPSGLGDDVVAVDTADKRELAHDPTEIDIHQTS